MKLQYVCIYQCENHLKSDIILESTFKSIDLWYDLSYLKVCIHKLVKYSDVAVSKLYTELVTCSAS
jgi:hypothetical protein